MHSPVRHLQRRAQPDRQPAGPAARRRVAGARRLDLLRRPAPARGPDPGLVRGRGLAVPVHRHDRLHDPAPAGVHRGPQGARARDPRRGAARQAADRAVVPELRVPGREELPALSRMPDPHQGPMPLLREADRPALGDVPLLRDPDPPRAADAGARRNGARGARDATARRPSATDSPSASALSDRRPRRRRSARRRSARSGPRPSPHAARPRAPRRGRRAAPARRRARSRRPTPTPPRSTPRRATARATNAPRSTPREPSRAGR